MQERINVLQRAEDGTGQAADGQTVAELVSLVSAAMEGPAEQGSVWRRAASGSL